MSPDTNAWNLFVRTFITGDVVPVRITRVLAYRVRAEVLAFRASKA